MDSETEEMDASEVSDATEAHEDSTATMATAGETTNTQHSRRVLGRVYHAFRRAFSVQNLDARDTEIVVFYTRVLPSLGVLFLVIFLLERFSL